MTSLMITTLTNPLAGVCFRIIRGWVNVARRGRGGRIDGNNTPWSRLPAWQISEQIAREFYFRTSTRSIYRALQSLEDAGLIRRRKLWQHERYPGQDYWYTVVEEPTVEPLEQSRRARRTSKTKVETELPPLASKSRQIVQKESPSLASILCTHINNSNLNPPHPPNQAPVAEARAEGEQLSDLEEVLASMPPEEAACMPSLEEVLASMPSLTRDELKARVRKDQERLEAERLETRRRMLARDAKGGSVRGGTAAAEDWVAGPLADVRNQMRRNAARGFVPTDRSPSKRRRTVERPERAVRVDDQGRTVKEVWVSGFKYLVVD